MILCLTLPIFDSTDSIGSFFHCSVTNCRILGLSLRRLSKRKRPFFRFLEISKWTTMGRWSEPSNQRYSLRPAGNRSNHEQFAMALSNLDWMKWVYMVPLHDKWYPECLRSQSPICAKKLLNDRKEPSQQAGPPTFSELSRRSLKSPVISHESSLSCPISISYCQKAGRFTARDALYMKETKQVVPCASMQVSIILVEEKRYRHVYHPFRREIDLRRDQLEGQ